MMEQTTNAYQRITQLTATLNQYRNEYYNLNNPSVSDEVYDRLFDELSALEQQTGIKMGNSPTQTVGYPAVSKLEKTTHAIPLLSLDKVKSTETLHTFIGERQIMLMLKLDGLTIKLTYEGGELVEAATRGDGDVGEVITHNARGISGIPTHIPYMDRLVVTGEAFIRPSDFEQMKETLRDSTGKPYKNSRNMAAGSVRLLDSKACQERRVTFMAFRVLEGYEEVEQKSRQLYALPELGFTNCKFMVSNRALKMMELEDGIKQLQTFAKDNDIPIDGIVVTYNDIAYSKSCGRTGHHYKDGLAFKFEDELYESTLRDIEWTPTRTGEISAVAIFDTVEIDGCSVSRATLHNLSFIEGLELMPGNRILISKRNMIIPQVEENLDRGGFDMQKLIPQICPCCGQPTRIHISGDENTKTLFCDNPDCETRRLRQFVHFAGEKAMDIEGLSEGTLEKLIGRGILHNFTDIYLLDRHKDAIMQMDGFGEKSWQRLWDAIQKSRDTTFERYMVAMDIPLIGRTASRALAKQFHSSPDELEAAIYQKYDFTQLPDFGETLHNNLHAWFQCEENWYTWMELRSYITIRPPVLDAPPAVPDNPFAGKTIVVTGKVEPYTREGINAKIESLGAHAGSSVSSKTDYLICGENAGSKLDKARSLGVCVLTPVEFFRMLEEVAL